MNIPVMHAARLAVAAALLVTCLGCGGPKKRKPIKLVDHYTVLPLDITEDDAPEIKNTYKIEIDPERIELTKEYLRLHNYELYRYLPTENLPSSIRFQPQIVVVHYTVIPTLKGVIDYFSPKIIDSSREAVAKNGALNVGVQFIVDRDGTIYSFYPENIMARHTIGLNHVAIGIENVGNADLGTPAGPGKLPLTPEQLDANEKLIRYLSGEYVTLRYLIGHHEYRDLENRRHPAGHLFHEDVPGYRTEKVDPGPNFMKKLRERLKKKP
ncbi:MAG: peptidoglycan recognition family protein [Acidobacteriota bacterium]|nr:peptidoglycan recognition family protein [Acidobacteriota bacterium]